MVDFNNSETIGTPALDIVRILVLERRYNVMEAIEDYKKVERSGSDDLAKELSVVQSRLLTFYLEVQEIAERHLLDTEVLFVQEALNSLVFEDLLTAFMLLNKLLDTLTITKLDTRARLPAMSRPELRNQAKGR